MPLMPPPQPINPMNPMDDEQAEGMQPDGEELQEQMEPPQPGMDQAGGAEAFNISQGSILLVHLAVLLRTLQLMAHNFHNLVTGPCFFSDHAFFGDLYDAYETAYDGCIERLIGTGPKPNLSVIQQKAVQGLQDSPEDAESMFGMILESEKALQQLCEQFEGQASAGTVNMTAQLADDSEVRCYKLQQRLGGAGQQQ